eukprot:scaffold5392_cov107-Cylindrotheca_fusiformis.AAC.9
MAESVALSPRLPRDCHPGPHFIVSIPSHVFNLVRGIVGVGNAESSCRYCRFINCYHPGNSFDCCDWYSNWLWLFLDLIGTICAYTGATSDRDAWAKSVGQFPRWNSSRSLLGTSRNPTLLASSGGVVLPLCLLKNPHVLSPFSLLVVVGMGYTAIAVAVFCIDGSYQIPDEALVGGVAAKLQPVFGSNTSVFPSKSVILISMLQRTPTWSLRYNSVLVTFCFCISILLITGISSMLGFSAFGKACLALLRATEMEAKSLVQPTLKDVVLGWGRRLQDFPGNIASRTYLEGRSDAHDNADRAAKSILTKSIIRSLNASGTRFLGISSPTNGILPRGKKPASKRSLQQDLTMLRERQDKGKEGYHCRVDNLNLPFVLAP